MQQDCRLGDVVAISQYGRSCPTLEMMMNHILLSVGVLARITDEQVDQLRSIPGVYVARVMAYTAAVHFPGDLEQLNALLARTKWTAFYMGESRTYRVQ